LEATRPIPTPYFAIDDPEVWISQNGYNLYATWLSQATMNHTTASRGVEQLLEEETLSNLRKFQEAVSID
jgi:hypothetical protein